MQDQGKSRKMQHISCNHRIRTESIALMSHPRTTKAISVGTGAELSQASISTVVLSLLNTGSVTATSKTTTVVLF
jgi:hypothetical protein